MLFLLLLLCALFSLLVIYVLLAAGKHKRFAAVEMDSDKKGRMHGRQEALDKQLAEETGTEVSPVLAHGRKSETGLRRRIAELEVANVDLQHQLETCQATSMALIRKKIKKRKKHKKRSIDHELEDGGEDNHDDTITDSVPVNLVLGMSGLQATVHIDRTMTLEAVFSQINQAHGGSMDASIQLSSCGTAVKSVERLLEHSACGDEIYATFFRGVDQMNLAEIAEELSCDDGEFKGHRHALQTLPRWSTPRTVADYLWENQILLTSAQAEDLFDQLFPKFASRSRARSDLIIALHSFCVHQHHIWEPNDGVSECLWANMAWGPQCLNFAMRRLTRGQMQYWEHATAVERRSPDQFPKADVGNLKQVLKARRSSRAVPLEEMKFVRGYGTWQNL